MSKRIFNALLVDQLPGFDSKNSSNQALNSESVLNKNPCIAFERDERGGNPLVPN